MPDIKRSELRNAGIVLAIAGLVVCAISLVGLIWPGFFSGDNAPLNGLKLICVLSLIIGTGSALMGVWIMLPSKPDR